MNESTFGNALDTMVRGGLVSNPDHLTKFVSDLYEKEQNLTMPSAMKTQMAANLGLESSAPISNRTRREQRPVHHQRQRPRWSVAIAVTMAALLAMTGIFQFGSGPNNQDDRFGMLSPAVPTADATPVAIDQDANAWLYPVDVHECPIEETEQVDLQSGPDITYYSMDDYVAVDPVTMYEPLTRAEPGDVAAVTQRLRQSAACSNAGSRVFPRFWTARFEYETRTTEGGEVLAADQQRRTEAAMTISNWYETELGLSPEDLAIQQDPDELGMEETSPNIVHNMFNPEHAVQFGDGRVGMIESQVIYRDPDAGEVWGVTYYPTLLVFAQDDGEWRLDESMPLCLGDCEDFWKSQPGGTIPPNVMASCRVGDEYRPDFLVETDAAVILRPGPSVESGDPVTTLRDDAELMSLCETAQSNDLQSDRLNVGDSWVHVRTELGEEGWIREIDIRPIPDSAAPEASPAASKP